MPIYEIHVRRSFIDKAASFDGDYIMTSSALHFVQRG
jgi:hypothetical protein